MNATNRITNRGLLILTGLLLAWGGAVLLLGTSGPDWVRTLAPEATAQLHTLRGSLAEWASAVLAATADPGAVVLSIGGVTGILVALGVFVCTRGGGRTHTVQRETTPRGSTLVDRAVADAVLAGPLRARPDVVSVRTSGFRVRGAPAIQLTVTPREGAHLTGILDATAQSVSDWDALAGAELPVVLHLARRGWLDRRRAAPRVH